MQIDYTIKAVIFQASNKLVQKINNTNKNPLSYENGFSFGADGGTRTRDLLITNQLLYQLSHTSVP